MKLHRDLHVTLKTALLMLHRVREAWTCERKALLFGPEKWTKPIFGCPAPTIIQSDLEPPVAFCAFARVVQLGDLQSRQDI